MKYFICLISILFIFATTGAKNPGTMTTTNSNGGTVDWTNPGNVAVNDGSYASVLLGSGGTHTSYYLKVTNFGFSINGRIDGILVEVMAARATGTDGHDGQVYLLKAGAVYGNDKADATLWQTTFISYKSYGGSADLWGGTWLPSDINDSTFGFVISYQSATTTLGKIDHIRITVTYTNLTGTHKITCNPKTQSIEKQLEG